MMNKLLKSLVFGLATILVLLAVSALLVGCAQEKTTGEKIEDAIEDAADAVGDAVDDIEDKAKEAKDEVEDAVEKAEEKAGGSG